MTEKNLSVDEFDRELMSDDLEEYDNEKDELDYDEDEGEC